MPCKAIAVFITIYEYILLYDAIDLCTSVAQASEQYKGAVHSKTIIHSRSVDVVQHQHILSPGNWCSQPGPASWLCCLT